MRRPDRPDHAVGTGDGQRAALLRRGRSDLDPLAVVDRTAEADVDAAPLEERGAPGRDQGRRQLGEHLDPRDERTGEAEPAGHVVVVDPVVGVRVEVAGNHGVRLRGGHVRILRDAAGPTGVLPVGP